METEDHLTSIFQRSAKCLPSGKVALVPLHGLLLRGSHHLPQSALASRQSRGSRGFTRVTVKKSAATGPFASSILRPYLPDPSFRATNLNCTAVALGPEPEDLTILRLFERDAGSTTDVINKAAFPAVNVNSSFQQNETTFFGINEQVRLFFPGGRQITLSVSFNRARSSIQMSCTLSGDLVT